MIEYSLKFLFLFISSTSLSCNRSTDIIRTQMFQIFSLPPCLLGSQFLLHVRITWWAFTASTWAVPQASYSSVLGKGSRWFGAETDDELCSIAVGLADLGLSVVGPAGRRYWGSLTGKCRIRNSMQMSDEACQGALVHSCLTPSCTGPGRVAGFFVLCGRNGILSTLLRQRPQAPRLRELMNLQYKVNREETI